MYDKPTCDYDGRERVDRQCLGSRIATSDLDLYLRNQ